jgi:hypothetical protein
MHYCKWNLKSGINHLQYLKKFEKCVIFFLILELKYVANGHIHMDLIAHTSLPTWFQIKFDASL